MAKAILAAGANLIVSGRNPGKLQLLVSQLAINSADRCHVVVGDLSTAEGVEALCNEVRLRFTTLHGLVNNASAGRVGELGTITADDFLFSCQHDMVAPFLLVKLLLPLIERAAAEDGDASIVNIGTMYGTVSPYPDVYGNSGFNNPIQYGAAKAGLAQMTRYLACHLGVNGVRVNCISPGPFPDTSKESAIPDFYSTLAQRVPLRRVGLPEEMGPPVVFLLSAAASFINGANLPVDGGWTAW